MATSPTQVENTIYLVMGKDGKLSQELRIVPGIDATALRDGVILCCKGCDCPKGVNSKFAIMVAAQALPK